MTSLRRPFVSLVLFVLGAALWSPAPAHAQSLFADHKARRPGDLLTVVLAEQTSAQRESGFEGSSSSSLGGNGNAESPALAGRFSGSAQINTEASSSNETVQRDLLEGTVTVRVVDVDEAGNLIVEGERRLNVNSVTHIMNIRGLVRPLDVRYNNTVLSHQIANADIEYRRLGLHHRFFSSGTILKTGAALLLGLAAFLGFS